MAKRVSRTVTVLLWLALAALGGFSIAMLNRANQPTAQDAQRPLDGEPQATGSLRQMRWCGAARWCH